MDQQTKDLLKASVRAVLATIPDGGSVHSALAELGWAEVVSEDEATAMTTLFTEQGRLNAATRALDDVLLRALEPALGPVRQLRAFAHPHPQHLDRGPVTPIPASRDGHGIVLGPLNEVADVVFPVSTERGVGLAVVTVDAIESRRVDSFDSAGCWVEVRAGEPAGPVDITELWPAAVAAARRALSAEILGTCETALTLAIEHTSARRQFGHPIASFQAVRHRLAEAHAAATMARSLLDDAWADGGAWSAALCKASAGTVSKETARHVLQVCGAMGLTEEHPMHRHVERGMVLDALYVDHLDLDELIGEQLLRLATVGEPLPRVVEL